MFIVDIKKKKKKKKKKKNIKINKEELFFDGNNCH